MDQLLDKQRARLYGRFVEAAYTMFGNPQSSDPLRPEPAGIPPGYELGAWIHMSDFVLDVAEPKFYGIVVHSVEDPDSRIIAIRGTEGAIEWMDDAAAILIPFRQVPSAGRVADGFDKIYSTLQVVKRPLPGTPPRAEGVAPETFSGSSRAWVSAFGRRTRAPKTANHSCRSQPGRGAHHSVRDGE